MTTKFNRLNEIHSAAKAFGVGYSFNYCESDDSWFFTINSVSPDEYWIGKNHSFDIAVDCVLEKLIKAKLKEKNDQP